MVLRGIAFKLEAEALHLKTLAASCDEEAAKLLGLESNVVPFEQICHHDWRQYDRHTDICVFCNSMKPHTRRR